MQGRAAIKRSVQKVGGSEIRALQTDERRSPIEIVCWARVMMQDAGTQDGLRLQDSLLEATGWK